jgi:hypothetical protein
MFVRYRNPGFSDDWRGFTKVEEHVFNGVHTWADNDNRNFGLLSRVKSYCRSKPKSIDHIRSRPINTGNAMSLKKRRLAFKAQTGNPPQPPPPRLSITVAIEITSMIG